MFDWYKKSNSHERKTFWACHTGWALDAFDVQAFSLVIPTLLVVMQIGKAEAGLLASVTLFSGALGGWLGGALSDRLGRVRTLQLTVTVFTVATIACAAAIDFNQLVVFKILQGLGFGAEWAAGAVLIAETIKPEHRGKAGGAVQSGWAVGWGVSLVGFSFFFSYLAPDVAWRALFAVSAIPAVFIFYLRWNLVDLTQRSTAQSRPPFLASLLGIFSRENIRTTCVGGLLGLGAHGGYYGLFTWLPTFLKEERDLSIMKSSGYLGVIVVSFGLGCLVAGQLGDRFGRRNTVAVFACGCVIMTFAYLALPVSSTAMLLLGCPLGFFAAGIPASMGALFNELYPPDVRGSGVGFCYNIGRVFAAPLPALVGYMSEQMSLATAIGINAICAYALVVLAIALVPDRRGALLTTNQPIVRR